MIHDVLKHGLAYHDAESERLAAELEAAAVEARDWPARWGEFAHLCVHTVGEHLGDWPRAARILQALLAGQTPDAETAPVWARLALARLLAGDPAGAAAAELAWMAAAEQGVTAAALELKFLLVAALVGTGRAAEAAPVYSAALTLARGLGDAAPARAIAVASNNLGSELLEQPTRTAEEDALMRQAAEAAHDFWLMCGDWTHDERARYLRALVANALGAPAEGLAQADTALAIIAAHSPRPVDEAFLHLARARSHHLLGDAVASASDLARSDAAAVRWDGLDEDLVTWHAEERARAFPHLPPREVAQA
ncbi:MAG TPA: hypothetical protein VHW60_15645 [Caulobacteraceae bacterium]|jgi:hypothetical protein|nr:hypothetical protein [Caulobacteraceae bacterium]